METLKKLLDSGMLEPQERLELISLFGRVARLEKIEIAAKALIAALPPDLSQLDFYVGKKKRPYLSVSVKPLAKEIR